MPGKFKMNLKNTLEAISVALNDSKIKFALIGGFALAAHGVILKTIKDYADMFGEWHTIEKLKSLI